MAAKAAAWGITCEPREKIKWIEGSVSEGEGVEEEIVRAEEERMGLMKEEMEIMAPAVRREMLGPRIWAVSCEVEGSISFCVA